MNILQIKDINYTVDNNEIIKGINLDIKEGECISLVGPSGSGKSTFLKLLSDLISQTSGEIYYKGKSYNEYEPTQLRKEISYCVQIPYLFGETVYDNLSYPYKIRDKSIDRHEIIDLMEEFNLDESYLYKDINSLSGGEKQRISLIRNLIFDPDILLLDEVTASLDKENADIVENIIKKLNEKGITIIWITHSDKQSTSIFNKRIKLSYGKIETIEEIN